MKQYRKTFGNGNSSSLEFKSRGFCFLLVIILVGLIVNLSAQTQKRTVGVLSITTDTSAGYTLFTPLNGTGTYLVDNFGREINTWKSDKTAGASVYLLEDGSLLRCESLQNMSFNAGGSGGRIKRTSWDGKVMWTYDYSNSSHVQQHDCEPLPNGNVLLLAWEVKSEAEAREAGRTATGNVWMDHIVEVKPTGPNGGEIVWEWHVWDHLIQDKDPSKKNYGNVADHPELIDINYKNPDAVMGGTAADWLHTNAVYYNPELDQIMISVLDFSEVWIIDHSTTTAEAASHSGGKYGKGGDLLYRFGNPVTYKKGTSADRLLYLQHDAHWIPKGLPGEGNVLVFNNGTSSRGSSVDEFKLPVDASGKYDLTKAPQKVWSYAPSGFYATNMGSAQRMPNGNTLICHGPKGTFYEVTPDKKVVWEYVSPVTNNTIVQQYKSISGGIGMQANQCFRASKYGPDFAGFKGKNITPGSPLEGGNLPTVSVTTQLHCNSMDNLSLSGYSLPSNKASGVVVINLNLPQNSDITLKIYNAEGREIETLVNRYMTAGKHTCNWNPKGVTPGIYFVRLAAQNHIKVSDRILVL